MSFFLGRVLMVLIVAVLLMLFVIILLRFDRLNCLNLLLNHLRNHGCLVLQGRSNVVVRIMKSSALKQSRLNWLHKDHDATNRNDWGAAYFLQLEVLHHLIC